MRDLIRQKIVDALITLVPAFYAGPCNGGRCQFSQFPPTSLGAATAQPWLALKAGCAAIGIGNGLRPVPFSPVTHEQCQTIAPILCRHILLGMAHPAGQHGCRFSSPSIFLGRALLPAHRIGAGRGSRMQDFQEPAKRAALVSYLEACYRSA